MSDLLINSDFFAFHNNQPQNPLKNSNNLNKSIEWMNLYSENNNINSTTTTGGHNTKPSYDGNNSPSNYLNINTTPILNPNIQYQPQFTNNQHQYQIDSNLSSSNGTTSITYEDNQYISPVGSPVPSYYSNSSNQSSPIQDFNNTNYSPQSPTTTTTITTKYTTMVHPSNQQQQQPQLNTTIPTFNQNVPSSPTNNTIHPDNYNLILNFMPPHNTQQPGLVNYQQPIQNFNISNNPSPNKKHHKSNNVQQQQQQQHHLQQPQHHVQYNNNIPQQQQDFSILNLQYQPGVQNVNLQSELEEFMDKPFNEESFFNSLKSAVPSFKDIDNSMLSSSSGESSNESDDMEVNRHSKKRLRDEDEIPEEIDTSGASILPKDKILKLSSKEIEEYVSRLKQNHVLTPAEEKELKKQRRLIKNREYASQSRSRRKQYVENIEQKLQKTNQENLSMKSQINSVKEENKLLKKQLFTFSATLKSNPSLAELFGKIFQSTGTSSHKAAASISIFVFFLLFTFTFFLPTQFNSPFSVTRPEQSFLQRNLLNYESFDHMSPLNMIYEKSQQIKTMVYEQSKDYLEKLFTTLSVGKNDTISSLTVDGEDLREIEPIIAEENNTEFVNPPIINIEPKDINSDLQQEINIGQTGTSLESNSPPLSPINE